MLRNIFFLGQAFGLHATVVNPKFSGAHSSTNVVPFSGFLFPLDFNPNVMEANYKGAEVHTDSRSSLTLKRPGISIAMSVALL